MANHPLGRAAEQHIIEPGVTVRGNDDEIDAELAGSLAYLLRRAAGAHFHLVKKSRLACAPRQTAAAGQTAELFLYPAWDLGHPGIRFTGLANNPAGFDDVD